MTGLVVIFVCSAFSYIKGYNDGESSKDAEIANANTKAVLESVAVTEKAVNYYMDERFKGIINHTKMKTKLEDIKDENADSPAPAIDQLFYDSMR